VRRPQVSHDSPRLGLDRDEARALPRAAERAGPRDRALRISRLSRTALGPNRRRTGAPCALTMIDGAPKGLATLSRAVSYSRVWRRRVGSRITQAFVEDLQTPGTLIVHGRVLSRP
jgi:hypothetical protein